MKSELLEFWKNAPDDPFDAFFEHAPVLMHSIDNKGVLTKVSRHWAAHLGYAPEDMIGHRSVEFLTEASYRKAVDEVLPQFIRDGVIHNVEYDFVRKDGTIAPILMSASSVHDGDGAFVRSLAIMFDNTEAKLANLALQQKAREAEEASRAKSRFLAAMSHEIRTPMNAILGFAQLLQMSKLDETRATHVDAILSAGRNLMGLLTDLLDLSQAEEGRMRIDAQPFSLHKLIHEVSDWWAPAARDKGLRLSMTIDKGLPDQIILDAGRLQQILNNLLENALKFTSEGRIELVVEEHDHGATHSRIRFEVRDTGPGLSPTQVDQLFRPFVQVDSSYGKREGGWGLGLSICHNLAEAMGAKLSVDSEPGRGATFFFDIDVERVPEASDENPTLSKSNPSETEPARTLQVLLVEDNPVNATMLEQVLGEVGHRVTRVENGMTAVEEAEQGQYDLILMDIMMPGLDGVGAARRIREKTQGGQPVPIVACSALVTEEAQLRYRAAGMDGFVPKPVDRSQLMAEINKVLGDGRMSSSPSMA